MRCPAACTWPNEPSAEVTSPASAVPPGAARSAEPATWSDSSSRRSLRLLDPALTTRMRAGLMWLLACGRGRRGCGPGPWLRAWPLVRPCPVADLGIVLAVGARVGAGGEALAGHELAQVAGPGDQARCPVDDVDDQMEAVQVVEHDHVEGGGGGAFFLVAADVEVAVAVAAVGEPVNQPRVAVEGEDDRPA